MRPSDVLILTAAASLGGCNGQEKYLREHIAVIEGRIATVEQSIEQKTAPISATTAGLDARASLRPAVAWTASYNARPAAEKTIRFRQTGRNGRLAGDDYDCGWFGSGGWYVELNSSDATRANLLLDNFRLYSSANQLTIRTALRLDAETRVHWHIDPCVGGGFGGNVFGDGDASGAAFLRFELLPMTDDDLPYRLRLVSPTQIDVEVRAHLGQLGTKRFRFRLGAMADALSQGTFGLLVDQSGEIGPLPNGQTYTYRLRTVNPQAGIQDAALRLTSDLALEVDPALTAAVAASAAGPE